MYAEQIIVSPRSISCVLHLGKEKQQVVLPLASQGMLQSVVAACAGALALDVSAEAIFTAVTTLQPFPQTMVCVSGKHCSTVIDDSYSTGEKAAFNAIQHLATFSEAKKLIIIVPIIELNRDGVLAHERLGKELAKSGANVIVYGRAYQEAIIRGFIKQRNGQCLSFAYTTTDLLAQVKNKLTADIVVLLEGRVPSVLRSHLI